MKYSEKFQMIFVGNCILPSIFGYMISNYDYKTRPIGMGLGIFILYFWVIYKKRGEEFSKRMYYGLVLTFFLQGVLLIHLLVGSIGLYMVEILDKYKKHDDIYSLIISNVQLLVMTIFVGLVFGFIAYIFGKDKSGIKLK